MDLKQGQGILDMTRADLGLSLTQWRENLASSSKEVLDASTTSLEGQAQEQKFHSKIYGREQTGFIIYGAKEISGPYLQWNNVNICVSL